MIYVIVQKKLEIRNLTDLNKHRYNGDKEFPKQRADKTIEQNG